MIEKITLENFKSHAHTEIELGRVTALVGPNGCGKTSVLQAAHVSIQYLKQLDTSLFTGTTAPDGFTRKGQVFWTISFGGRFNDLSWETSVQFDPVHFPFNNLPDDHKVLPFVHWKWGQYSGHRSKLGSGSTAMEDDLETLGHMMAKRELAQISGSSVYFKGIAESLASPSTALLSQGLLPDGKGLASVLANVMTSDRKRRDQIEHSLRTIVPTIREVNARFVNVKVKEKKVFSVNGAQFPYEEERDVQGNELIFNTISGSELPAYMMSEGTLLILGLLTLLHSSTTDIRLFLLDDIEQGLHPLAQRRLIKTLREFAEQHDKQILLTTHSGYIVDELGPEDVWVLQTDAQGISHAKRLSEHEDAKRLLEVLTTGELADAVGEDWVLPQAPQAIAAGEANA